MKLFLLSPLLLLLAPAYAQQRCSLKTPIKKRVYAAVHTPAVQEAPAVVSGTAGTANTTPVRIPVVVHVVYHTSAQNISDEQVRSGIDALNRDFRRQNADTVQTPAAFRAVAADMELEFVLATSDPEGRATNGIVRRQTAVKEWGNDDKIKFTARGGSDAWDGKSYLNIWVGQLPRSLGWATAPGSDPATDGIVITTSVFGTLGKRGNYNMGRTLVHETGHWLGLMHIWGDTDCGDDGIWDTPPQAGFTSGCPAGPVSTCNNAATGDMYMNYMDFTNDACMNLFTKGQKEKAWACLRKGKERYALTLSKGLLKPWNNDPVSDMPVATKQTTPANPFYIYPNPATAIVQLSLPGSLKKATLQIVLLNGRVIQTVLLTTARPSVSVEGLAPGIYLFSVSDGKTVYRTRFVKLASGQ